MTCKSIIDRAPAMNDSDVVVARDCLTRDIRNLKRQVRQYGMTNLDSALLKRWTYERDVLTRMIRARQHS